MVCWCCFCFIAVAGFYVFVCLFVVVVVLFVCLFVVVVVFYVVFILLLFCLFVCFSLSVALRPQKPHRREAQDGHPDFHTAPDL